MSCLYGCSTNMKLIIRQLRKSLVILHLISWENQLFAEFLCSKRVCKCLHDDYYSFEVSAK